MPFKVTKINGNQINMSHPDGSTKIRDKNQVRILKDRPVYLTPSWSQNNKQSVTNYADFDIESNSWKTQGDTAQDSNEVPEAVEEVGAEYEDSVTHPEVPEVIEESEGVYENETHIEMVDNIYFKLV